MVELSEYPLLENSGQSLNTSSRGVKCLSYIQVVGDKGKVVAEQSIPNAELPVRAGSTDSLQ